MNEMIEEEDLRVGAGVAMWRKSKKYGGVRVVDSFEGKEE